jgi:type IV secretory pathway VirB9-like protein
MKGASMTKRIATVLIPFLWLACGSLVAGSQDKNSTKKDPASSTKAGNAQSDAALKESGARSVKYGERDVVTVKTKLRYTTLIILPKEEEILDFVCGDKEYWVVNGNQNFAYIKPARSGAATNINLITASGNVYSFVLSEISESTGAEPDLKVFVEPKEESMMAAIKSAPRFVSSSQIKDYEQQVAIAKAETREARQEAERLIETRTSQFVSGYPVNIKFGYRFTANKKPFLVTSIFHDERFTYIKANPEETPALYEVKDGKPNLLQFEYRNGTYIVPKVIDSGYLTIGRERLEIERKE